MHECIFCKCKRKWVVEGSFVSVQSACWLINSACILQLDAGDFIVALVKNVRTCHGTFLFLDYFIEDAVDGRCWNTLHTRHAQIPAI
jgi:hypothetical protein